MPFHRSITRINRNQNNEAAINMCCAIVLAYIILSLVLSSFNLDSGTIFFIIIVTFGSGTCIICCCFRYTNISYDIENENENDNENDNGESIPTITAYPIPVNREPFHHIVPVVCTPVVE